MLTVYLKGGYYMLKRLKENLYESGCHFEFLNDELDVLTIDSDEGRVLRQFCEDIGISIMNEEVAE